MTMRFYVNNFVKSATITPSEVNAQFPSSNLQDDRRTKVYRSTTASCDIVFDFGSAKDINSVAIVDSGISSFGFTSATIELNSTNTWTSPAVSQVLTIDAEAGWVNYNWSSLQNYRYARLVLTNATSPVELSKLFIGKDTYLESVCFSYPLNFRYNNRAIKTQNRYGQKFFDEINTQKELGGSIPSMNKTELDTLLEMIDYASFTKPIWLNFNATNMMNDANRISGYYYLDDDPVLTLQAGNFWNVNLSLTEGM
jgi:hypothetical protein